MHGGLAIAASPGVRLSSSAVVNQRSVQTFEYLCSRVVRRGSSCTVLLIYRPGSITVWDTFDVELSSLLDDLATLAEPVFVAGDFNIRLDRPDDTNIRRLSEMFEAYGLTCRVSGPTHDRDRTLDVVATRSDLAALVVDSVIDVSYCDHRLVRWTSDLLISPTYTIHRPVGHGDALMSQRSKKHCGHQLCAASLMTPVTMALNNSPHRTIARSMPLRIVLCQSILQPVAIVRRLTRGMVMIVALLAVDVGDLSSERSDTRSSWMRLVRNCGRIAYCCGRRDLIFGAPSLKATDTIRDTCGSRSTSLLVEDIR
jgi:hypothetical protein